MTQERKALLILAVALASIVFLAIRFGGREAPATLTQQRLNTLKSAVIAFTASHGEPPRALTDLQVDTEILLDHIGEPFLYEVDGAMISITSHGADREPGGFFFKRDYVLTFDPTDSVIADEWNRLLIAGRDALGVNPEQTGEKGVPMRILKGLAAAIGVAVLAIVALVIGARFVDGPIGIIPGGPLEAGELVSGAEPDWTFARDVMEMEFQLVEPPHSRTIWLQVHDKKLYVVSGYMNSTLGKIWKQWPAQALQDGRALVRIDGRRYERKLVRILDDGPLLEAISAEVNRKYGAALRADMAASGDAWFFALQARDPVRPPVDGQE